MSDAEIGYVSAVELQHRYSRRELSPVEAAEALLRRIGELNSRVNAFVLVDHEGAIAQATRSERAWIEGTPRPLEGVPVSIKDLNAVRGLAWTQGSLALKGYVPDHEGVFVRRLRDAGAVILGKTNTPEFGTGFKTDNKLFGLTVNPWNRDYNAGGSSGGAAVAVAMGFHPVSHGNDGGGSIRVPASYCHVFGLKPSFGRIPNDEAPGHRDCLHEGMLSRSVADAALFLNVCSGPDPADPYAVNSQAPDYLALLGQRPQSLRIAWTTSLGGPATDPEISAAVEEAATLLATSQAEVEEVSLDYSHIKDSWRTILFPPLVSLYPEEVRANLELLVPQNQRDILDLAKLAAIDYFNAAKVITGLRSDMLRFFENYDLLLCPVSHAGPLRNDDPTWDVVRREIPSEAWNRFLFTFVFNCTGNPAASVPWGFSKSGLPIAIQIVGRLGEDERVLQAAHMVELERPWVGFRPPAAST